MNKMKLVPAEATDEMVESAPSRRITEPMYGSIYRAMAEASLHGGKVSHEMFVAACMAAKRYQGPISQSRAVIEALGLEIEE